MLHNLLPASYLFKKDLKSYHGTNPQILVTSMTMGQGGITPMADSVMCMPVTVNFAT